MVKINLKNILNENNHAVSAVIGVILMVAITVAIAATVYVYVSGMMGGGFENTPTVSMIAESSDDEQKVIFTIISITDTGVNWNNVFGVLVNISSGTQINISEQVVPQIGTISGGDIFYIKNVLDIDKDFTLGDEYRFTLVYDVTGGTMGTVTWIH